MNQIAKICQQFVIIFISKIFPAELRVACFRTVDNQVVTPYFTGYIFFQLDSIVSKDSSSMSLAELSSLVV
jgi:hypothetical protein